MARHHRLIVACALTTLLGAACAPAAEPQASEPAPTTTADVATTTTQASTSSTTTTTQPPVARTTVDGDIDSDLLETVSRGLTAINDPRATAVIDPQLVDHHEPQRGALVAQYTATASTAELAGGGRVGVVTLDTGDLVLVADEGDGWRVAGTHLSSLGAEPFYGASPRRVLVLGSDARPGQNPPVFRMDSIHVLTAVPGDQSGAILGYPRDSWVNTKYGSMRVNALTSSGRGPEAIYDFFTDEWNTPVEGYILTGFAGFERLVDAVFGRLEITIPIPIPEQEWFAGFRAGEQSLTGLRTLDFARTRKLIPGGDFTRSFHQGIVMLAALTMIQRSNVEDVPMLLAELSKHTETNLDASDLIQLGVAAFEMDIASITNEVLPGRLGRTSGGASVVFLESGWETIVADVVDDGLRNDSSG